MKARTRWLVLIGVVLAGLAAGCSAVTSEINTINALQASGFSSVHVSTSNDDISVSVSESTPASVADDARVAEVVWNQFHERFDFLFVTVNGTDGPSVQSYSFDELQARLGPRPAAWNRNSITSGLKDIVYIALVVIAGIVGVVLFIVLLVVRRRRRRRGSAPGYGGYGAYPGAGMWPPGPYPQQGAAPQYPPGPFGHPQYPPAPPYPVPPQYPPYPPAQQYPPQYPAPPGQYPTTPPPPDPPRPPEDPPPAG